MMEQKNQVVRVAAPNRRGGLPDVGTLRSQALAAKQNYLMAVELYGYGPSPERRRRVDQLKHVYYELREAVAIVETPV
jgi:hypothetical protein